MYLLHLAVTSRASLWSSRTPSFMCPYAGCNAHPAATRPRPRPHGPSKDARSPDVLRTSRHGSLIPSLILHAPVAFSSPHVSDTRRLLPLSQMGPPGVATCSCAPTSKRYSRIQTSSPHRVWPLHVQVCAPFTYGQFSKVSPVFICGRQMQRAAQLWPPPPTSSYYPPPDSRPRPRRGPSSLDGLHRPRCSPTSSCASPTLGATPSRLQAPQPLPALPAAAPPIPAVPPSCASPLPQMCTLPAPPHSPPRPERRPPPTLPRAVARPGPCSRDAPRGLPPLFPPCLARRLPPNLRFPAGHSSIQSNSGSRLFPSVLCGRARPTSSPFQGVSRPGDYNSQRPPRNGGSDVARPRPSTRPRPRPPKSAREVGGANLGLRGCSGRDAQHSGARAWREASGTRLAGLQGC